MCEKHGYVRLWLAIFDDAVNTSLRSRIWYERLHAQNWLRTCGLGHMRQFCELFPATPNDEQYTEWLQEMETRWTENPPLNRAGERIQSPKDIAEAVEHEREIMRKRDAAVNTMLYDTRKKLEALRERDDLRGYALQAFRLARRAIRLRNSLRDVADRVELLDEVQRTCG